MMTKLAGGLTALALILSTFALAQEPPTTTAPSESPPLAEPDPAMPGSPPAATPPQSDQGPSIGSQDLTFLDSQKSNELRGDQLRGLPVKNNSNDAIGTASDIVIDEQGKIVALLIGSGGFLGIGGKLVGVPFDQAKLSTDATGERTFMVDMTRERFESAPGYVTAPAQKSADVSRRPDQQSN